MLKNILEIVEKNPSTDFTEMAEIPHHINNLQDSIFKSNVDVGWWTDLKTGEYFEKRSVGEMIALVHSEMSEALEGDRKDLMDDHLPHRKNIEVELADAIIRILDLAGGLGLDVAGAIIEKLIYNQQRADHKVENRLKSDGKKI